MLYRDAGMSIKLQAYLIDDGMRIMCSHICQMHQSNNIEEAIENLKVTLVDCSENEENLKLLVLVKSGVVYFALKSL